jgi:hypothetical protein
MTPTARRTRIVVPLVALLALLVPASAADAASFVAHLKAPTHSPKAGKRWPIKVTATTRSGKGVRASAYYQFVYNGSVVRKTYPTPSARPGRCPGHRGCRTSPYPFRGSFRDPSIVWPKRAVGFPLTFRVVVDAGRRGTKKLDYRVRVKR